MLNVHPSLLPRWRGAAPIERAIMAGDEHTGVSIMRVTAGLDSGPVCLAAPEPIDPQRQLRDARAAPAGARRRAARPRPRRAAGVRRAGRGAGDLRRAHRARGPHARPGRVGGRAGARGPCAAPAHRRAPGPGGLDASSACAPPAWPTTARSSCSRSSRPAAGRCPTPTTCAATPRERRPRAGGACGAGRRRGRAGPGPRAAGHDDEALADRPRDACRRRRRGGDRRVVAGRAPGRRADRGGGLERDRRRGSPLDGGRRRRHVQLRLGHPALVRGRRPGGGRRAGRRRGPRSAARRAVPRRARCGRDVQRRADRRAHRPGSGGRRGEHLAARAATAPSARPVLAALLDQRRDHPRGRRGQPRAGLGGRRARRRLGAARASTRGTGSPAPPLWPPPAAARPCSTALPRGTWPARRPWLPRSPRWWPSVDGGATRRSTRAHIKQVMDAYVSHLDLGERRARPSAALR